MINAYAVLALVVIACGGNTAAPKPPVGPNPNDTPVPVGLAAINPQAVEPIGPGALLVSNQVTVVVPSSTPLDSVRKTAARAGARVVSRMPGAQLGLEMFQLELPTPSSEQLDVALSKLRSTPSVIAALRRILVEPLVPLDNGGLPPGESWAYDSLGLSGAWDLIRISGVSQRRIQVGIIDSGLEGTHPEFAGLSVRGQNLLPNVNPLDWSDDMGHGTAVAGVIGAGNNGSGMNGVLGPSATHYELHIYKVGGVWNSIWDRFRVCSGKVFDLAAIYFAMANAAQEGVDVLNASFTLIDPKPEGREEIRKFLLAILSAAPNLVLVAGAGNSNENGELNWPLGDTHERFILVGGTGRNDLRWSGQGMCGSYGSAGGDISLAAPAEGVRTSARGGGYGSFDGTSMAAPLVSGAAALLLQLNVPPAQVKAILKRNAKIIHTDRGAWRRVNLCRAIAEVVGRSPRIFSASVGGLPAGSGPPSDLYRVDAFECGGDQRVGRIRTSSGEEPAIWDLALTPTGLLWGISSDKLYLIDLGTGLVVTETFLSLPPGEVALALAADGGSRLFAATHPGGLILQIDRATGRTAVRASLGAGFSASGDLAFSPSGELYATARDLLDINTLRKVNLLNGNAAPVGSGAPIGFANVFGLAFIGNELLGLALDVDGGGNLIRIDTNTGAGRLVRRLTFQPGGAANVSFH